MTKQPFPTDFPLVVFATAKRRLKAAIRRNSAIITRRSLSGYAVLFEDMLPGEFLASIDPTERQRSFCHIPVFWVWLAQILEANASAKKPSVQKPGCGFPTMGIVGLLNLRHGGWEHIETCA